MDKTVIIYYSHHHNNTKKLLDAIKAQCQVDLVPVEQAGNIKLENYSKVGFASGIYYAKFADALYSYVVNHKNDLKGKKTFLLATGGGSNNNKALDAFGSLLNEAQGERLGNYYCNGWDTFGPFKIVGGIRKKHPNEKDCNGAVKFYQSLA